jgi:hypothetical protein
MMALTFHPSLPSGQTETISTGAGRVSTPGFLEYTARKHYYRWEPNRFAITATAEAPNGLYVTAAVSAALR